MQFNGEVLRQLSIALKDSGFATVTDLDKAVAQLIRRHASATPSEFSISTLIRGLSAQQGRVINSATREADINYTTKALATTGTPGSYLVPTIQANEIIGYLSTNGIARAAGARIWPMNGLQKLTVPTATGLPTVQYLGQNSTDTATDPNLGQVSFDLKTRRSLVVFPNELLASSVPGIDSIITALISIGLAEHEDNSFFATSTVSGGPTALMSAASISTLNTGGSANGGNLAYSDLTGMLAKVAAVKAKPPFVWICSPRTFWTRIVGLLDTTSRPIFIPGTNGLGAEIQPKLFGYPVFVTPFIPENEALGSGTNQSHMIFCNPKYLHIADGAGVQIAVSLDRYFELNQVGIRATHQHDFGYAPAAGICVLKGIN